MARGFGKEPCGSGPRFDGEDRIGEANRCWTCDKVYKSVINVLNRVGQTEILVNR